MVTAACTCLSGYLKTVWPLLPSHCPVPQGLSALSGLAHLAHAWAGAPAWVHALHAPPFQAALSVAALLGKCSPPKP